MHGHICTSSLVCVLVAFVNAYFCTFDHIIRSCVCVCVDSHNEYMCVLGVQCVSRNPKPEPEPVYKLFDIIFNSK